MKRNVPACFIEFWKGHGFHELSFILTTNQGWFPCSDACQAHPHPCFMMQLTGTYITHKFAFLPHCSLNYSSISKYLRRKQQSPLAIAGHLVLVGFFYSFSFIHLKRLRAAISNHMTSALTIALNIAPVSSVFFNAKCVSPQPTLP